MKNSKGVNNNNYYNLEDGAHKILGDFEIKTDPLILVRRPDLVIV